MAIGIESDSCSPIEYPTVIFEQVEPLQYPKTPKLTPLKLAIGMAFTMGVEMVARTSRTNATNIKIVNGVAGRNIVAIEMYAALKDGLRSRGQRRRAMALRCADGH